MPPTKSSRRQKSRQAELFPRSKRPVIELDPNHRLVQVTDELDWTELGTCPPPIITHEPYFRLRCLPPKRSS